MDVKNFLNKKDWYGVEQYKFKLFGEKDLVINDRMTIYGIENIVLEQEKDVEIVTVFFQDANENNIFAINEDDIEEIYEPWGPNGFNDSYYVFKKIY